MANSKFLGGVTAYDSQGNERNILDGQGSGTSDPTLIICDGTLGQEVEIVGRIQADIDSGRQNLAYRFSGRLLVSDTPQFDNNIMLFDFTNNSTCMVSLDFSDCELVKKGIDTEHYTAFMRVRNGGILKVESIKLDYIANGGSLCVFAANMYSTVYVNNADIKCDCNENYTALMPIDSAEIHARDCNINGNATKIFRAFYTHTGGKALTADNCKINGTSGNDFYAFCIEVMGGNVNSYRVPEININNCTIDGTSGNDFRAFYVQANNPFSSIVNVSNCTIKGTATREYLMFFLNSGVTSSVKSVFIATNCIANIEGEVCSLFQTLTAKPHAIFQVSNIHIESSATDKVYIFLTDANYSPKLLFSQVYIRKPKAGDLVVSLEGEAKYIVTNCIFPSRSIEGMPQADTTTGSQIWCNNIYEE